MRAKHGERDAVCKRERRKGIGGVKEVGDLLVRRSRICGLLLT
jgi:hypothetical protein